MTRQTALLRLQKNLLARRKCLGNKLAGDLASLHDFRAADSTGDSADLAFAADDDEISTRLAELGDRGLNQIERALARWSQGAFGICESCQKPISMARLTALPCTPFCISCVREMEKYPDGQDRQNEGNWGKITDAQPPMQDPRINLAVLERDMPDSRRS